MVNVSPFCLGSVDSLRSISKGVTVPCLIEDAIHSHSSYCERKMLVLIGFVDEKVFQRTKSYTVPGEEEPHTLS